jgi:hypothetical protein
VCRSRGRILLRDGSEPATFADRGCVGDQPQQRSNSSQPAGFTLFHQLLEFVENALNLALYSRVSGICPNILAYHLG